MDIKRPPKSKVKKNIKMRQLGGEQLKVALEQLDAGDGERSQWQQRMRTRLSLATPVSQKTTGG